jgi:RNA recognition motif-containing protein
LKPLTDPAHAAGFVFSNVGKRSITLKKLFVGSLPPTTTEESLQELFAPFGKVRSLKLAKDLFSGKCKGFAFLEMEGHEARAAMAELNGKSIGGNLLKIRFDDEKAKGNRGRHR